MRVLAMMSAVLGLVTACATPIVEDRGSVTVDGRQYVVQFVTFDTPGPEAGPRSDFPPPDPYYQVVVDGQPYRCAGGVETCAAAVEAALRRQSAGDREERDEESEGDSYSPPG